MGTALQALLSEADEAGAERAAPKLGKFSKHLPQAVLDKAKDPDDAYFTATYRMVGGAVRVVFEDPPETEKRHRTAPEWWYRGFRITHDRLSGVGGEYTVDQWAMPRGYELDRRDRRENRLGWLIQTIDRRMDGPK